MQCIYSTGIVYTNERTRDHLKTESAYQKVGTTTDSDYMYYISAATNIVGPIFEIEWSSGYDSIVAF